MNFIGIRDLVTWDPDDVCDWARRLSGKEADCAVWLKELAEVIASKTEPESNKWHAAVALFYMPTEAFANPDNRAATVDVVRGLVDLILKQHCDNVYTYRLANQALVAVSQGFVDQPSLKA